MGELEVRGPWVAAGVLRHARAGRPLDGRRLVQDRRHRLAAPARVHPHPGPLEGRDQVRRRVDLVGRARERADGPPGDRRGGRDRGAGREVGRAAAGGRACCARARRRPPTSCASSWPAKFAKWWVPDCFEFVDEIPKTAVGKFRKTALREMFSERRAASRRRPESRRRLPSSAGRSGSSSPRSRRLRGRSVVRVRAAGVNFMDVLIRRGDYPQPPELPAVLGGEVAGELDGRRVMALPRTAATRRRWRRTGSCRCPDGASFAEGASFLMTFLTAWIPMRGAWSSRGRPCSCTRARAGSARRRCSSRATSARGCRDRGLRGEARVGARARRRRGVRVRGVRRPSADVVVDPVGGEVFAASLQGARRRSAR